MEKKLVVLGSINADHVIQVPRFAQAGETLQGSDYRIAYGGKGANQAVAAARAGANVSFIGCIGEDEIGQSMKQAFAQDGIDTDYIQIVPQTMTGIAMIQVSADGENSIVLAVGANAHLDEKIVEQNQALIQQADALLLQLEVPLPTVIAAAKWAKQGQTTVVLNPAPAQPLPEELLQNVDIITPNETEAELLTGIKVVDEQSAVDSAKIFHAKGIKTVLITLGAKGVFVSHQTESKIVPAFYVQAVDTTAAGDTFNGALVTALLENQPLEQAIRFAQGASAISVTRQGAQSSIPTRAETLQFLAQKV